MEGYTTTYTYHGFWFTNHGVLLGELWTECARIMISGFSLFLVLWRLYHGFCLFFGCIEQSIMMEWEYKLIVNVIFPEHYPHHTPSPSPSRKRQFEPRRPTSPRPANQPTVQGPISPKLSTASPVKPDKRHFKCHASDHVPNLLGLFCVFHALFFGTALGDQE
ncbi:hypothetical protein EX30DRAFT_78137 [Ascodesmis nigricans]|uniref:Uncharacterized protein n=1 Tax=Ascodesmis nigricans TaxID=341454 RepID=A0A4S2MQN6_9PEZI|nr:hypothetical protein EX30DRAFT_78137 [Ascodesmis nigricans]